MRYLTKPKPQELSDLYDVAAVLFAVLKEAFEVPDVYLLPLHDVDAARAELRTTPALAAITLRKLQALRLAAGPGEPTTNDIVVGLAADLNRSVEQLADAVPEEAGGHMRELLARVREAARSAASLADGDIVELR